MQNINNLTKGLVVSVALALVLTFGNIVLFGSGVSVDPSLDWEKINSMQYSEANTYIAAHTKHMTGWEMLKVHGQWLAFATPAFFALVVSLFIGCLVLLRWVRHGN